MVDIAYFVKWILPRAFIGSFKHFVDIYFSKSVSMSVCGGVSSKSYLLPSFIFAAFVESRIIIWSPSFVQDKILQ